MATAIDDDQLNLTESERAFAHALADKLERRGATWKTQRCLTLLMLLLPLGLSAHCLRNFWTEAASPYSVMDRLDEIELPEGAPPDAWVVAELRRSVRLLEMRNGMMMLATMEGVFGLILGMGAVVTLCLFVPQWNLGLRSALLSKLLRRELAQTSNPK